MLFDIKLGGESDGFINYHYPVLSPLPIRPFKCLLPCKYTSDDGDVFVCVALCLHGCVHAYMCVLGRVSTQERILDALLHVNVLATLKAKLLCINCRLRGQMYETLRKYLTDNLFV